MKSLNILVIIFLISCNSNFQEKIIFPKSKDLKGLANKEGDTIPLFVYP